MRFCNGIVLLCLLAAAPSAFGKEPVAVVELQTTSKRLTVEEVQFVTAMLREAARDGLDPARYVVMTRETMEVMIPAQDMRCMAGTCLIDIGKRLQAAFVVGGGINDVGGEIGITLEAYETLGGMLKGATTETAADVKDAVRTVRLMAAKLIRQMTGAPPLQPAANPPPGSVPPDVVDGGPRVRKSAVTAAVGDLTVQAKTASGEPVRLEVTDPSGRTVVAASPFKDARAAVGTWKVAAKARGHEAASRDVAVPPDDVTVVKIDLKPLGGLKVTGEPAGSAVKVTGPGGFRDEGGLPWEAEGLIGGTYRVEVDRAGYVPDRTDVTVAPGRTETLAIRLSKVADPQGAQAIDPLSALKARVFFPSGKAAVPAQAFPLLDEVAQVLKDHPSVVLQIEGNADSRESAAMALSTARAEAVFRYLVGTGVGADRMTTKGFGPQKPISSNQTPQGRAANRNVEFRIMGQ